jgi:hypothetical protein
VLSDRSSTTYFRVVGMRGQYQDIEFQNKLI